MTQLDRLENKLDRLLVLLDGLQIQPQQIQQQPQHEHVDIPKKKSYQLRRLMSLALEDASKERKKRREQLRQ